ncbi:hypothetical protein [Vibrio parahaemolyticus]|uniref:hypothetical protein n=1 Tax=Vibrio parahaemolyticus TaxID=670 RepID=UPI0004D7165F|nr:hypothetical protein [Vibrio parahaemolyticus]EGQ8127559.1 hypothetical protein [Vibrio parahaemolyticus]ODX16049.1 hypothetical protein BBM91_20180 [Vibrio parahaemolyticus]OQU13725.1 hypothetical protein EN01_020620 [Vibrio parahaemolyticus]
MELAINHSKVKSGNGKAKYFVRTGEVISSNLESTTHTYSDTTVTGRSYITSRTKKKTVFWLRFDNGQERKYVLNGDVDILNGQKISLLYLEGKKSTCLVGIANHTAGTCIPYFSRTEFRKVFKPNRENITLLTSVGLVGSVALYHSEVWKHDLNIAEWLVGGFFYVAGVFFVSVLVFLFIALIQTILDFDYYSFKKEVTSNLNKII